MKVVTWVAAVLVAVVAVVLVGTQLREVSTAATAPPVTTPPPADPGDPLRVTIPAIGVDAALVPVGLKPDGAVQTPDFGLAAWYSPGPRPGEAGPSVVLAHVDSAANGPDVFFRLNELAAGDEVVVHYRTSAVTFVVTGKEQTAKTALPTEKIWNGASAPVLRLITCGGGFDRAARSYLDNVIVYADQLG
ncbi:sortase domain-containing protein [Actinophytocola algeriensis]|uniref:Sortase (Surface protein transpeptidase) n=1 Tax=Actinophytocola algeriensis TaxID=1768010 RepID=A0A7W7QAT9_9PSEU|nr:sortase [Actinophytocola algeriensis]MBB4909746.1 sortase (surface protein transpeptidase) [Actinophytocola algeriensis]MBE1475736.1 sortase (surface protein transpeptidase) [Actinophytocola algeriensis]